MQAFEGKVASPRRELNWLATACLYVGALVFAIICLQKFIKAAQTPGTGVGFQNAGSTPVAVPFPSVTICDLGGGENSQGSFKITECLSVLPSGNLEKNMGGGDANPEGLKDCAMTAIYTGSFKDIEKGNQDCVTVNLEQKIKTKVKGVKRTISISATVASPSLQAPYDDQSGAPTVNPYELMGASVTLSSGLSEFETEIENTDNLPLCSTLTDAQFEADVACFDKLTFTDRVSLGAQVVVPAGKQSFVTLKKTLRKFPITKAKDQEEWSTSIFSLDFTDQYNVSSPKTDVFGDNPKRSIYMTFMFETLAIQEITEKNDYEWNNLFGDVSGVAGFLTGLTLWGGPPIVVWNLRKIIPAW